MTIKDLSKVAYSDRNCNQWNYVYLDNPKSPGNRVCGFWTGSSGSPSAFAALSLQHSSGTSEVTGNHSENKYLNCAVRKKACVRRSKFDFKNTFTADRLLWCKAFGFNPDS